MRASPVEKVKRLVKWNEGKVAAPFTLGIGISSHCNLNCIFCARRKLVSDDELSTEQ